MMKRIITPIVTLALVAYLLQKFCSIRQGKAKEAEKVQQTIAQKGNSNPLDIVEKDSKVSNDEEATELSYAEEASDPAYQQEAEAMRERRDEIPRNMMPEWRQKIVADKEYFLEESRARYAEEDDTQILEIVKERIANSTSEPLEKLAKDLGIVVDAKGKVVDPEAKAFDSFHATKAVPEDKHVPVDIDAIITLGKDGDMLPMSAEYKKLIRKVAKVVEKDPSFELKLAGDTYGLGARGINVDGVRVFKANDIKKLLAKITTKK